VFSEPGVELARADGLELLFQGWGKPEAFADAGQPQGDSFFESLAAQIA
jgi:hypothetical protein